MFIILAAIGFLLIMGVVIYNNLVGARNQVENAFGTIDVMLKKRYDLIPNLVETAKVYMKHERDTLTGITELRTKALSGNVSSDEKVQLENQISGMMKSVMVAVENYPDLKASEQFTMLQRSWNETEEQISAARRNYNASMFGHKRKSVLEIPEAERQNVSAKALFNS
jgi:LemA protein